MIPDRSVHTLTDLVAYQEGAVVSKTLLQQPGGSVTLFAFAKDQGLSEHNAPFEAMVCVLDGVAEITLAGRPARVRSGEMLVLPAHVPHALRAVEPFKMLLVMLRS